MTGVVGFKQRYRGSLMPLIVLVFMALYFPSFMFKYIWMDVRSVTVTEDLSVTADREIKRNFTGSFDVVVRRLSDHRFVCSGQSENPRIFTYRRAASGANPVQYQFPEWAGLYEQWQVDACLDRGLQAGDVFYIDTCHDAYLFGVLRVARRCVPSWPFTPSEAAISRLEKG